MSPIQEQSVHSTVEIRDSCNNCCCCWPRQIKVRKNQTMPHLQQILDKELPKAEDKDKK